MAIANSDGSIILVTKVVTDGISKGIAEIRAKFKHLRQTKGDLQLITEAIKEQKNVINELSTAYNSAYALQGPSKDVLAMGKRLNEEKEALKEMQTVAIGLGQKTTKSFSNMAKSAQNFGKRIAGIIKSALIFSVLYKVMQSVVKLFQNILMSDEEFRQDWEELKAAFYTATYPIVNLIVPAIKYIVQQVRDWAVSIGKVAAALQRMSYSELVDQAESSKEAADNYADIEKSSKKTADNVKKQLASFDDIQILSSGNNEEQGAEQYAGFEGLKEYDTSGEKSMLNDLMTAIGGALAAVGLILLFNGQIGWGIGFLVAGAAFWAIGEIWGEDYDPNSVSQTVNNIMETLGVSLAAIGIILLIKGIYGWGIGFLIGGAAFWAISEIWGEDDDLSNASVVVENIMQTIGVSLAAVGLILLTKGIWTWGIGFIVAGAAFWAITEFATGKFSEEPIVNTLIKIMGIAGTALVALGIILLVFGQIVWGVTMLAVGAVMLVTALALNNEAIVEAIRGPLGVIMAIVGAALLALGIILVCTGVGIPLGIALIAAGAASLVTVVALNWESITKWIKKAFNDAKEWVKTYGGLVLGILLLFTGVGAPFGMALIMDAVSAMGTGEKPVLWDSILQSIKTTWNNVKAYWNENIADVWTLEFWLGLAKVAGNGLIDGFELAINGIVSMFEKMINWIVDAINSISFDLPDILGGGHVGFNLSPVKFSEIKIPRLAQGAVIPPNREFLAVLGDQKHGTNIEAPAELIKQMVREAMFEVGGAGQTTREEHYYLNEAELMSIVYRLVKGGERLNGKSLVDGGVY